VSLRDDERRLQARGWTKIEGQAVWTHPEDGRIWIEHRGTSGKSGRSIGWTLYMPGRLGERGALVGLMMVTKEDAC